MVNAVLSYTRIQLSSRFGFPLPSSSFAEHALALSSNLVTLRSLFHAQHENGLCYLQEQRLARRGKSMLYPNIEASPRVNILQRLSYALILGMPLLSSATLVAKVFRICQSSALDRIGCRTSIGGPWSE